MYKALCTIILLCNFETFGDFLGKEVEVLATVRINDQDIQGVCCQNPAHAACVIGAICVKPCHRQHFLHVYAHTLESKLLAALLGDLKRNVPRGILDHYDLKHIHNARVERVGNRAVLCCQIPCRPHVWVDVMINGQRIPDKLCVLLDGLFRFVDLQTRAMEQLRRSCILECLGVGEVRSILMLGRPTADIEFDVFPKDMLLIPLVSAKGRQQYLILSCAAGPLPGESDADWDMLSDMDTESDHDQAQPETVGEGAEIERVASVTEAVHALFAELFATDNRGQRERGCEWEADEPVDPAYLGGFANR